jgi:hypothetical protein
VIAQISIDRPIYICGLARSGSTILLEMLATHPEVVTHQYKDFPILHIPYWWNWFLERASRREAPAVPRAHQDRIMVTSASPEAMEEMLWMTFFPRIHDASVHQVLDETTTHGAFEQFYRDHIRKLLAVRGGTRYGAKNNYNISRLGYLHKLFPDARFVIPVRDPLGHIASLMKQHRLFCAMEEQEPKVLRYMQHVGHYEFGLDLRPITVASMDTVASVQALWQSDNAVQGWARYWALIYNHVCDLLEAHEHVRKNTIVVHYDDLCRWSKDTLQRLYTLCELDNDEACLALQAEKLSPPSYYAIPFTDEEKRTIAQETHQVHARIREMARW